MNGPSKTDLGVIGAVVIKFECKDAMGNTYSTKQLSYVCESITSVYMSRQGCQELRLLDKDFPTPRPRPTDNHHSLYSTQHTEQTCGCPTHPESPLPLPKHIPEGIDLTKEGAVAKLKEWIIAYYEDTVFNNCEHSKLPQMTALESPGEG